MYELISFIIYKKKFCDSIYLYLMMSEIELRIAPYNPCIFILTSSFSKRVMRLFKLLDLGQKMLTIL